LRILLTGGYGFIGSWVAEILNREGHEIIILDNLSKGRVENVVVPHLSYVMDIENRLCESVFRDNSIDAVIHLAAQISVSISLTDPLLDTSTNLLGLTNMLTLSSKYGIKKFIFASSAAVYGVSPQIPLTELDLCDPISPYGINKLLGEYYCTQWTKVFGLPSICFRFSNVYGPRQGYEGEGGVISLFMDRLVEGKELVIYGDGGQTRDYIYVEDVAEALVRSLHSEKMGIFNLSSNEEHTIHRIIEVLGNLHSIPQIVYQNSRPGDIYRSRLCNDNMTRTMKWSPSRSLEEGLKRTYNWHKSRKTLQSSAISLAQDTIGI
jgi:UDP-glucuronate decarboxylase